MRDSRDAPATASLTVGGMLASGPHIRVDLGPRVELVTADRHFHEISIALYRTLEETPSGVVHSYSHRPGTEKRLEWLARAVATLGGFLADGSTVAIPCGVWHERGIRRMFLDAAKLDPIEEPRPLPLATRDTRRGFDISVEPLGFGRYKVGAVAKGTAINPATSVAAGLAKLAEASIDEVDETIVGFSCKTGHDQLVAALLPRAINIRATLREQEMESSRGLLLAPSAQPVVAET